LRWPSANRRAHQVLFTESKRLDLFKEWHSGFSVTLSATHKKYDPLLNLPEKDIYVNGISGQPLNNFETSAKFRFAYLEKFLEKHVLPLQPRQPVPPHRRV